MDTEQIQLLHRQYKENIKLLGLFEEQLISAGSTEVPVLKLKIDELREKTKKLDQQITRAYGLEAFEGSDLLISKAAQLRLKKNLTPWHLVNCDRSEMTDEFWDFFEESQDNNNPYQFYFILACPTQQPDNFAERMVYELQKEELKRMDPDEVLWYPRRSDQRDRVAIENLPMGRKAEIAADEFKAYFNSKFPLQQAGSSFEHFLETGIPKLGYKYINLTFGIQATNWKKKVMRPYLEWLVKSFSTPHKGVPTFIFSFVIFLKNAHTGSLGRYEHVLKDINAVVDQFPDQCILLDEFSPVIVDDLEGWLMDVDQEKNAATVESLIKTFISCLPEDKKQQYAGDESIDMTYIERLQKIVYQLSKSNK